MWTDVPDTTVTNVSTPAPEVHRVTVWCHECQQPVSVEDVHAFILARHYEVCSELVLVNGEA